MIKHILIWNLVKNMAINIDFVIFIFNNLVLTEHLKMTKLFFTPILSFLWLSNPFFFVIELPLKQMFVEEVTNATFRQTIIKTSTGNGTITSTCLDFA